MLPNGERNIIEGSYFTKMMGEVYRFYCLSHDQRIKIASPGIPDLIEPSLGTFIVTA